jgi:serine/threonine-protein kinase
VTGSSSNKGSGGRGGQPGAPDLPETIGRYRITRLLGHGGQGDVYLARHPTLDVDVAVKVLHPEYRTEEFIERFSNEARITARLDVRNIVRVYDFDPEYPYLVMEYCGDGDLSRYIKSRRRRPLSESLGIVRQVLEALVAAHENNPSILHRDLKPSNVLFAKGVPKVADFGLAKAMGAGGGLTTTRGMMGTIRYCSPEQMKDASSADSRTDLWSVGIMLYEMLAWRRPFDKMGDSDSNVMFKVHMEPPAPPPYEIPAAVMSVVQGALEKDRDRRFPSARAMTAAMDEALRKIPGADKLLLPPEAIVDDLSRMAAEISSLLDQGQSEAAESVLKSLRKRAPDDSVGRFWRDRLKEVRDRENRSKVGGGSSAPTAERQEVSWITERLSTAESLLQKRDYREARRLIGEILYKAPDNTSAHRWLERIGEEERRLREDLERGRQEAERARSARDYATVLQTWKDLDARYAGMPEIQSELAVALREKEVYEQARSREEAARRAGKLEGEGDLKGAIAAWGAHLARHPDDEEALQLHEKMTMSLAAHERAERLAGLMASAMERRNKGDAAGALALWEGYLLEDPTWEEAAREVKDLRRVIAERERAARLEEARSKAAARQAAGDPRGALSEWEAFSRSYPDETAALDQIRKLKQELAERERKALVQEVEGLAAGLRSRVESGRYRSLKGHLPGLVAQAIESARAALSSDAAALAKAREALVAAGRDAETTLAGELSKWRREVQGLIAQNRDWIPGDGGARASAEEERLATTLGRAMAVLCAAQGPASPADSLEPLIAAHREMGAAAGALTGARQKSIEAAQGAAARGLQQAQGAVQALLEIAGAQGAGDGMDPADLRARLEKLREEAGSKVPDRLAAVARQAQVLAAEAGSARLLALQDLIRELGDLMREGRAHLIHVSDEKLEKLVRDAARWVEPEGAGDPISAKVLVSLRQELRRELETTRSALNERIAKAEERWRKAEKAWRELLTADLGATPRSQGERIVTGGQKALTALRAEELESWAGQLEGLVRRYRLESIWIEQSDALLEIEGTLGPDGLPSANLPAEDQELLARYRTAAARGETEQVRSLAGTIEKRRARLSQAEPQGPAGPAVKVPALGAQARKLNAKYNAAMLKLFDDLQAKHKAAVSGRKAGEAARLAAELARAHRRLLQPQPMWKRGAITAAAVAVVIVTAFLILRPAETSVKVTSLDGKPGGIEITQNGRTITGLARRQEGASVVFSGLRKGHYAATAPGGGKTEFDVPGADSVLLHAGEADYSSALVEELDLKRLVQSP